MPAYIWRPTRDAETSTRWIAFRADKIVSGDPSTILAEGVSIPICSQMTKLRRNINQLELFAAHDTRLRTRSEFGYVFVRLTHGQAARRPVRASPSIHPLISEDRQRTLPGPRRSGRGKLLASIFR